MQLPKNRNCKMERLQEDSFIGELYQAMYRTCVATSMLNILPAFIEANMWHYTDPRNTGFSLFAALTFVAFICTTSFLFLCKRVRKCSPNLLLATLLSFVEPALLLAAASPAVYDQPKTRTIILGVGVGLLPLVYSYVLCNAPCGSIIKPTRRCCVDVCKFSRFRRAFRSNSHDTHVRRNYKAGTELLLAALLTLSLRWCAGSINIFYTTWETPLVLFICTMVLGIPKLASSLYDIAAESDLEKQRNMSGSTVDSDSSTNRGDSVLKQVEIDIDDHDKSLIKIHRCDTSDTPVKPTNRQQTTGRYTSGQLTLVWACAIVDGIAKGFLFTLFLWFFTSPALLRLWSGLEGSSYGIILLICFAASTVVASTFTWDVEWESNKTMWKGVVCRLILVASIFLATGLQLLGESNSLSFLGSCIYIFALPQALTINLGTSAKISCLSDLAKSSSTSIKCAPGLTAILTAITFVMSEVAFNLFVNPSLSKTLLGRMDVILYTEITLIAIALVAAMAVDWLHETKMGPIPVLVQMNTSRQSTLLQRLAMTCDAHKKSVVTVLLVVLISVTTIPAGPKWKPGHCLDRHGHAVDAVSTAFRGQDFSSPTSFSVMSWNVLFGHDMLGNDNLQCLSHVTQAIQPDIFAVQESDAVPIFWGGKDILGFLQNSIENLKAYYGVEPLKSSLGVGLLTKMKVTSHDKFILPCSGSVKLPHYSMTKTAIDVSEMKNCTPGSCSNASQILYVFNIHAVFKNWTESSRPMSRIQIDFLVKKLKEVDPGSPVLAIGDFNLNPFESELDLLYGELNMESALHPHRSMLPVSSLLNRNATVDHIFYRGLTLLSNRTITEAGNISDHRPVYAVFDLQT